MDSATFHHRLGEGQQAFVYRWLPPQRPRAVVQVIHGMAEHAARYQRLAQALNAAGYAVYAQDLPGHGRTARAPDERGHFADADGWQLALSAINGVRGLIERELDALPHVMLGHSMGSFLLQDYVIEHGQELAGAVFSAACGDLGPLRAIGLALLRAEGLWRGQRHRSALAEQLTFKDFNRRFRPNRTEFDWLSRDTAEVDKYIADPLCGFRCSVALWRELLQMAGRLDDPQRLARIPRTLPVLLLAGEDDPACRGAKGPRALERHYREAGLSDVSVQLYPQARHELFNELCRDSVTADLLRWLDTRIGG